MRESVSGVRALYPRIFRDYRGVRLLSDANAEWRFPAALESGIGPRSVCFALIFKTTIASSPLTLLPRFTPSNP